MTAPTDQEIAEAIEAGYHQRPGFGGTHGTPPELSLESAVSDWWSTVVGHGLWDRWPCEDENCPARPAYDQRIDEMLYDALTGEQLVEHCADLVRGALASAAI